MQYLFGDTDLAAQRHRLLADVFAESSRAFLLDAVEHRPDLAVDLGCGPGYSTHLLAESLRPARTAGFDSSKNYISTAQKNADQLSLFSPPRCNQSAVPHRTK